MKKLHLLKTMLLLCALIVGSSSVWAEDELHYTLDGTQSWTTSGSSAYATGTDTTQDGITWNVTGNTTLNPWGIGGKNLNAGERTVYSKTGMTDAITKVELEVGAASSVTVNSLKLVVASDEDFSSVIDEVTKTFAANSTITFTPTSPLTNWETGAFYKFVFTLTIGNSNKKVEFKSAKFYKTASSTTATTTTIDYSGIKTDRKGGKEAGTLTASVTETVGGATVDGAEVTWSSSDEDVATIDPATGAVTLVAEGATTITASYAGNSTYAKSSGTYELVVNDTRDAAGLSYDVSEQTIHVGQVHEAFTLSNPNSLGVTYSSNNTDVATVDPSTGAVTGVAVGSATITAAFDGDDNYTAGQASYTLNVDMNSGLDPVGPNNSKGKFVKVTSTGEITDGDYLIVYEDGNVAFNGALETLDAVGNTISIKFASKGVIEENDDNKDAVFTIDVSAGTIQSASGHYIGIKSYSNGLKQSDSEDAYSNSFAINNSGNVEITATFASGTMYLNYNSDSNQKRFRYYKDGGQQAIQLYKYVKGVKENTFNVTVGAAGWRTIVTNASATLPSDIKAYIVTNSTSNSAKLTEKTSLKANTPYLLEAEPGTYTLTVTDTPDEPTGNLLQISNPSTTNGVYVLGNVERVGFYKWTGGLLGAGRVYLPAPDSDAREFLSFDFEGETTSLREIRNEELGMKNAEYFNLNGQRVAQPTKGLYIVNGRKVVIK